MQPEGSKLCGHCCVAMVLGISLAGAVELIGHRRGVWNREIVAALLGQSLKPRFTRPPDYLTKFPDPCLIRLKSESSNHWHVVFYNGGKVYDPAWVREAPSLLEWYRFITLQVRWRIVSVLPLTGVAD